MYDSGISTANLIASVAGEADITVPIDSAAWYRWINAVEQFVYTEIFKEYVKIVLDYSAYGDELALSNLNKFATSTPAGCAAPVFDDIIKVYADETELERSGVISRVVFTDKPLYYADYNGNIVLNPPENTKEITVIYRIRPNLKAKDDESHINLPVEFVDMLAARLRAETYKIANEDGLSAKWMADYNTQLETLKVWAAVRNERYGE